MALGSPTAGGAASDALLCILREARDIAAGDADTIARVRAQMPLVDLPLTQRNAQLVIAREYG